MHLKVISRLENRRKNVLVTLEHIRAQEIEVEANTEWKDVCAQRRRTELLAELRGWYSSKLNRIDHALGRAARERERTETRPRPDAGLRG
jgi:hypothetical protein